MRRIQSQGPGGWHESETTKRRRAIKRRRERGLLALLARWPVKLRYEFVLCKHMMKILILPRREINDDVSVEG